MPKTVGRLWVIHQKTGVTFKSRSALCRTCIQELVVEELNEFHLEPHDIKTGSGFALTIKENLPVRIVEELVDIFQYKLKFCGGGHDEGFFSRDPL